MRKPQLSEFVIGICVGLAVSFSFGFLNPTRSNAMPDFVTEMQNVIKITEKACGPHKQSIVIKKRNAKGTSSYYERWCIPLIGRNKPKEFR